MKNYSRWNWCYNTSIDYKKEENEEYLFYNLSNCLLAEFNKEKKFFLQRREIFRLVIKLFKEIEKKRKDKLFCNYFDFLCIQITNGEINGNKEINNEIKFIIEIINRELHNKFMSLNEIENFLKENKLEYKIKGDEIIIYYDNNKYIIDNYKKYNIDDILLREIINSEFTYDDLLKKKTK